MFTPDGLGVVYVRWPTGAPRLGVQYCYNRASTLHYMPLTGTASASVQLAGSVSASARGPTFSPSGTWLAWLSNVVGGPHAAMSTVYAGRWQGAGFEAPPAAVVTVPRGPNVHAVGVYRFAPQPWLTVRAVMWQRW